MIGFTSWKASVFSDSSSSRTNNRPSSILDKTLQLPGEAPELRDDVSLGGGGRRQGGEVAVEVLFTLFG